jgi:hypothetical protein
MALSEKHRSSIYQGLIKFLGEEEAQALLSQFPARDLDEPVTKEFVRAEIAEVRTEIAGLRADIGDRFREQTMWMAGSLIAGMGVAVGIASALG